MHGCLHARAAKHVRGCMRSLSKLMCVLAQRYEVIDPMQGCKHRREDIGVGITSEASLLCVISIFGAL